MATTEQRLAALEQKMQMLTTPPDDYYMSRWTGEEIDAAVATAVNAISKIVKDYSGTEAPDIDTILDSSFVIPASASKNCPVAGNYIIIYQFFYAPSGTVSAARPRTQIALPYSAGVQGKGMALRTFSRESVWSGWEKIYTAQQPPTAAEVGAAPAGFGWGDPVPYIRATSADETYETYCAKIDEILSSMSNRTAKLINAYPPQVYGKAQATVSVLYKADDLYVSLFNVGSADVLLLGWRMVKHNGTWQPFEWVNPQMLLGVNYRTTERFFGKPVYLLCGTGGEAPDSTSKNIYPNFGAASDVNIIDGRVFLTAANGSSVLLPIVNGANASLDITSNFRLSSFEVKANGSSYVGCSMYYWVKYIKNSDA